MAGNAETRSRSRVFIPLADDVELGREVLAHCVDRDAAAERHAQSEVIWAIRCSEKPQT